MNIKKAYEIHDAIEEIIKQDKIIENLHRAIEHQEHFNKGELTLAEVGSDGLNISVWKLPIEKENIELFLNLLSKSMENQKRKNFKTN